MQKPNMRISFTAFFIPPSKKQIILALNEEFVNSFKVDDYSLRKECHCILYEVNGKVVFAFVPFPFKRYTLDV